MGQTSCTASGCRGKLCCGQGCSAAAGEPEGKLTSQELTPAPENRENGEPIYIVGTLVEEMCEHPDDFSEGVDSTRIFRQGTLGDEDRSLKLSPASAVNAATVALRMSNLPPKKFDTKESMGFRSRLQGMGLDTSEWSEETVNKLRWEVEHQNRCVLMLEEPTGTVKRALRLVKIRILADIFGVEHVLMSRMQVKHDGTIVHRKQLPLRRLAWTTDSDQNFDFSDQYFRTETCPYTEDWQAGCKKALKDRLGLSFTWQQQHLEEDKFAHSFHVEDNVVSQTYPGLLSCYAIHEVVFRISDAAHAGTQCIGLPSGQEFATTEGDFEASIKNSEYTGRQLNLWTWERYQPGGATASSGRSLPKNPIKRVPIPVLSAKVLGSIHSRAGRRSIDSRPPSVALRLAQEGRATDWPRVIQMASRITEPDYSLASFYQDLSAFPELDLYLFDGDVVPASLRDVQASAASSGRTIGDEYQRTVGAFFAIYWLMRLSSDGKEGFSFGVDDDYKPIRLDAAEDSLYPAEKRLKFYRESRWDDFQRLLIDAELLVREKRGGKLQPNSKRVMTLLALTAVHDIMKVQTLLPTVQPEHAPYRGYAAGDIIGDHDHALGYLMDHFPELLPSFSGLCPEEKASVKFTQCQLCFNQGWFVQAEAPPGSIFTGFREILKGNKSTFSMKSKDIALYFVHWLTDLAGAEPTPLGGCEKFVIKFPLPVLNSFLRSFKSIQSIATQTETEVTEGYLKMRWKEHTPSLGPVPTGDDAIVKLRLLCMSQMSSGPILKALGSIPKQDQELLSIEMSRTGCQGQSFSKDIVPKDVRAQPRGPAFLIYYGPAYLQSLGSDDPAHRLLVLVEVYRRARELWPASQADAGKSVTVRVDAIKALSNRELLEAEEGGSKWVLLKKNNAEAFIDRSPERELSEMQGTSAGVCILRIGETLRAFPTEARSP